MGIPGLSSNGPARSKKYDLRNINTSADLLRLGQETEHLGKDAHMRVRNGRVYIKDGIEQKERFNLHGRQDKFSVSVQLYTDILDREHFPGFGKLVFSKLSAKHSPETKHMVTNRDLCDIQKGVKAVKQDLAHTAALDREMLFEYLVQDTNLAENNARQIVEQRPTVNGRVLTRGALQELRSRLREQSCKELEDILVCRERSEASDRGMDIMARRLRFYAKQLPANNQYNAKTLKHFETAMEKCQGATKEFRELVNGPDALDVKKRKAVFDKLRQSYSELNNITSNTWAHIKQNIYPAIKDLGYLTNSERAQYKNIYDFAGTLHDYCCEIFAQALAAKPSGEIFSGAEPSILGGDREYIEAYKNYAEQFYKTGQRNLILRHREVEHLIDRPFISNSPFSDGDYRGAPIDTYNQRQVYYATEQRKRDRTVFAQLRERVLEEEAQIKALLLPENIPQATLDKAIGKWLKNHPDKTRSELDTSSVTALPIEIRKDVAKEIELAYTDLQERVPDAPTRNALKQHLTAAVEYYDQLLLTDTARFEERFISPEWLCRVESKSGKNWFVSSGGMNDVRRLRQDHLKHLEALEMLGDA